MLSDAPSSTCEPRGCRVHARAFLVALLVAAAVSSGHSQQLPRAAALDENFDIRTDGVGGADVYRQRVAAPPAVAAAISSARAAGVADLEATFVGLELIDNQELGTLEVVSARVGGGFLTEPAADRASALRGFVSAHALGYGLSQDQVSGLELVADYVNPAGNMAWVEFEQRINGLPVFQGLLRGGFTARGELARTTGRLASGLDAAALPALPVRSAEQAVSGAAAHVGWGVSDAALVRDDVDGAGRVTLSGGGMARESTAWLVYFPLAPGVARLAWATQIWGDPEAYLVVTDAEDGTVLFRKNLTNYQTQPATYIVYDNDSPAPMSPSTVLPGSGAQAPFIGRSTSTLIGNEPPNTFNNLGWMTDGANGTNGWTDGNNVEAGVDRLLPDGVDAPVIGTGRVFDFTYNAETDDPLTGPYQNGEVTDTFYHTNKYHDRLYSLGFTEAARNFQADNFSRGGVGGDRISAEVQNNIPACNPAPCVNNANFSTPVDGGRGRMQMYIFPGPTPDRSSGLDHDVLIHELTHGTSNRLHSNATGLTTTLARGMGEGWSDFYARALLSTSDENVNGIYSIGGWVTHRLSSTYTDNYYYGIRRFPYAVKTTVGANGRPHNPLTLADIDPDQVNTTDGAFPRNSLFSDSITSVHNIGEIWCVALLEVRARFITRLGHAAGNLRILQFVTDGMKLDPVNPTLIAGRDAILAAANAGGGTAADIADIWAGFAARGMGSFASIEPVTHYVRESFMVPGEPNPTLSIDDVSVVEGQSGTRTATFAVTLSNPAATASRVRFTTADGTATAATTTTSATAITVPSVGSATPYPSSLTVSGLPISLQRVSVRLNAASHTWPEDMRVLLVGPGGQKVILMSGAGSGTDISGVNLTFEDGREPMSFLPIVTGTYSPSSVLASGNLPAPAPVGPYSTALSVFNGTDPNGTWNLYVSDVAFPDAGTIGGFSLILTTAANDYVPATGSLLFDAGTSTQTVSVTINGDTSTEPGETFFVNLFHDSNAVLGDGQGQGVIADDDGAGVTVLPTSGLVTTEAGGTATFTVVLQSQPTANVTIPLSSSDTTEGTVDVASLTFTPANWNVAQTVTLTGVDDAVVDGPVDYSIVTGATISADASYSNTIDPSDVSVTNTDDDVASPTTDLAVDFGSAIGLWTRVGATWNQLNTLSPVAMVPGDLDGNGIDDLVINFGAGFGVYAWMNHATWLYIHSLIPSQIVTGDIDHNGHDDIVFDFPGFGLWRWSDGAWTSLHALDASRLAVGQLDGALGDELIVDFPGHGVFVYYNNATWTFLNALHPTAMLAADLDGSGRDDLVVTFGPSNGLWVYRNNATWAQLNTLSPVRLASGRIDANAQADLVIDFGPGLGIYTFRNNATWVYLHPFATEGIVLANRDGVGGDEIVIDFGPTYGLWQYTNDSTWEQLHPLSPDEVVAGRFH